MKVEGTIEKIEERVDDIGVLSSSIARLDDKVAEIVSRMDRTVAGYEVADDATTGGEKTEVDGP